MIMLVSYVVSLVTYCFRFSIVTQVLRALGIIIHVFCSLGLVKTLINKCIAFYIFVNNNNMNMLMNDITHNSKENNNNNNNNIDNTHTACV